MSCIRFNTPAQRAAMKRLAPSMLTAEQAAALHPSPEFGDSKLRRLRLLAGDANPKIREAAASSYHLPDDLARALAADSDAGVRAEIARNEHVSCDVLRELADDESERVRGMVAVNFFVPDDVMVQLADDDSDTVRSLVRWKAKLAEESVAEADDAPVAAREPVATR